MRSCYDSRRHRLADIAALAFMYERERLLPIGEGNGLGSVADLPEHVRSRARWLAEVPPSLNVIQGTVDTVVSRLFTESPDIEVQTSNARFEQRKMAQLRSAALNHVMNAADSRARHVIKLGGRDGALKGFGAVRPLIERGMVRYDRIHQYQLFWDALDARDGEPEVLHYWHLVSRSRLVAKLRAWGTSAAILNEVRKLPRAHDWGPYDEGIFYGPYDWDERRYAETQADRLHVVHSWKLPGGPDPKYDEERGRYVITVFGTAGERSGKTGIVIYDSAWERQTFPVCWWTAHPNDEGIDGFGFGQVLWPWQAAIDRTMAKIQATFDKLGHTRVLIPQGMEGDAAVNERDLLAKGITAVYVPPQLMAALTQHIIPANPVSPQELQHLQWMLATSRAMQGINDGLAEGTSRLGANASAVAMIEEDHRQIDRLADIDENFTGFKLAIARETLNCIDDEVERNPSFAASWQDRGGEWRRATWKSLSSDSADSDVGVEPVGALGKTRSGRLTKIREWAQQGFVDGQIAADAMMTSPDVARLAADMTAPRRLVERQLDDLMIAAIEGKEPEGDVWPDKHTPLETAKGIVDRTLQRAIAERADAAVIENFQQYKFALEQEAQRAAAEAGPGAGGMPEAPELTQAGALGELNPVAAPPGAMPMPPRGMPPGPMGM